MMWRSFTPRLRWNAWVSQVRPVSKNRRRALSTNLIESCLSAVRHVIPRCGMKRWRGGAHIARWTAAGLVEAEKKFRRVKGYRELTELARKLNPGLHSAQQVA